MAATANKKKKSKGMTVNLNDFLANESGGGSTAPGSSYVLKSNDWADQMDEQDLDDIDTAYGVPIKSNIPRATLPTAPRSSRGADVDLDRIPDRPPFTAFLGNLPYDVDEECVIDFFKDLSVSNVRLPSDTGRMKGFGYAEFGTKQDLLEALTRSEDTMNGRKVRIDIADHQTEKERGGDYGGRSSYRSEDDGRTETDWRARDGPSTLDSLPKNDRYDDRRGGRDRYDDRRQDDRGGFDRGGDRYDDKDGRRGFGGGFRRDERDGGDRDDQFGGRARGFGGRDRYDDRTSRDFGSSRDGPTRDSYSRDGPPRDGYSRSGPPRDYGPSRDRPTRDYGPPRDYGPSRDGPPREYSRDGPYGSSSDRPSRDGPPGDYGSSSDRPSRDGPPRDYGSSSDRPSRDSERDAPTERPKLNLKPRSKPSEVPSTTSKSSSIFGGAKPVDTAAKEREIEERLKREHAEDERRMAKERTDYEYPRRGPRRNSEEESKDSYSKTERRTSSSSSGKNIVPPAITPSRTRKESEKSQESSTEVFEEKHGDHVKHGNHEKHSDHEKAAASKKSLSPKDSSKLVPAPPPKENPWARRAQNVQSSPPDKDAQRRARSPSPLEENSLKQREIEAQRENPWDKGSPGGFVAAAAPNENPWTKRQQDRPDCDARPNTADSKGDESRSGRGDYRGRGGVRGRDAPQGRGAGGRGAGVRGGERNRKPKTIDDMPKKKKVPTATLR